MKTIRYVLILIILLLLIPLIPILIIYFLHFLANPLQVFTYKDGFYMHKTEIRKVLIRNDIILDTYNLKGVKGRRDSHGDCFIKITFNFKNQNFQYLTNNLVVLWKKNKNYRGLSWDESSKWEISKKNFINKNKKIDLSLPKGSLIYKSKYQQIGIDTNSMKCVYHELFP